MKPRDGLRLHEDEHVGKGLEALTVADMTGRPTTAGTEPDSGGFSEEPESFVGLPPKARFRLRQQTNSIDDKIRILHSSRMLVDKAAPPRTKGWPLQSPFPTPP